MTTRSYLELSRLSTFEERLDYLRIGGGVGVVTFGFDRDINQRFYSSKQWQDVRDTVLMRDRGCDLGIDGYEIHVAPLIHHMNPMVAADITHGEAWILDPEFLITTSHRTHNTIHYSGYNPYPEIVANRSRGDTQLW